MGWCQLFSMSVERRGSEPAKFSGNFDIDEGKRYILNKPQLSLLKSMSIKYTSKFFVSFFRSR